MALLVVWEGQAAVLQVVRGTSTVAVTGLGDILGGSVMHKLRN